MASFSDDDPPAVILSESEDEGDVVRNGASAASGAAGSMGPRTSEVGKPSSKQFSDEELKKIAEIFGFMKSVEPKLSAKDKQWLNSIIPAVDDHDDTNDADAESDSEKVTEEPEPIANKNAASPATKNLKKPPVVEDPSLRYAWDWKRTEAVYNRCVKTGLKGVLPTTVRGQPSAKLTDVFDAQIAVQWVRRMEQLRASADPLPMRGPFDGKLPRYKKLQENPLRMTALPLGCDLKLSADEKAKAEMKPYRLGSVCPELQNDRAFDAWNTRSAYLKQFEVLSLQLERLAAVQTMVVTDLLAAFKHKENVGSPELRAMMADINPRLQDLRCLNDFLLNRSELLAYSTFKASKCIYLEALGYPKDEWGELINRKWGATDLFDVRDSSAVIRVARPQKPVPLMGPPMNPMRSYPEPSRGMHSGPHQAHPPPPPPPFYHEQPMMRPYPPQMMGGPHPGPPPPPPPSGPPHFYGQPHWADPGPPMGMARPHLGFGGPARPRKPLYEPKANNYRFGQQQGARGGSREFEQNLPPKILRSKPKPGGATAAKDEKPLIPKVEKPAAAAAPVPRKVLEDVDLDSIDSILQEVLASSRTFQDKE